jgi:uncharacterized protein with ATP-grasp and redox domains
MKIQADCVPCLMKRVLFQSRLDGRSDDYASVEAGLKAFAENISRDKSTVEVATAVHAASYSKLSTEDPYRKLKVSSDAVADRLTPRAQAFVDAAEDRLSAALLVSAIGNIMDFGSTAQAIDGPEEFEAMFDKLAAEGLGLYDQEVISSLILGARSIMFVFDNCGESQLDRILIRELRKNGKRVTGVLRGKSILNDVTVADAERSGLDMDLDKMVDTGKFFVGVDWSTMPDELKAEVLVADLIIMKGMANYEGVSDVQIPIPIIHILRAKCIPVAESIGVPQGTNAVFAVLNGRRMGE